MGAANAVMLLSLCNKPTVRQQYRLKVSKTAVLICMLSSTPCVDKETGLLKLSVKKKKKKSLVACCFKAVIHEMYSMQHSQRMIKRKGVL